MRTIASLFSGIGGLELGLERAGLGRVVVQVEQDERCRAVLARHWPEARRFDDVRTVGVREIGQVDVICGGFPCQDISLAGKGAGLAGERSGLWFEYLRIVKEVRPRVVIVENVAALRSRGLDVVLAGLHEAGYWTAWDFIHASDVGAPHRRKRLFIVAVADAECVRLDQGRLVDVQAWEPDARSGGEHVADAGRDGLARSTQPDRRPIESGEQAPLRRDAHGRDEAVADAPCGARLGRAPGDEGHAAQPREVGVAVANADGARFQGHGRPVGGERATGASAGSGSQDGPGRRPRERGPAQSRMGRVPHGIPAGLDGVARFARAIAAETEAKWPRPPGPAQHPWEPPRTAVGVVKRAARLKALGNAVIPQVAEAVGRWALYLLDRKESLT